MQHISSDLRHAARRLAASPGFTAAAVLTISLGVGINTGAFSVFNAMALRNLPAGAADELVSVHQLLDETTRRTRNAWGAPSRFSTSEYRTYRDETRMLSGIAGYSDSSTVTLGGDVPEEIVGTFVTCNYFEVLERRPAFGPGFAADCDAEAATPSVVLGHELWTTKLAADPNVIGREVVLNRQPFVVVGVAPEGMRGVDFLPAEFFAPISAQPSLSPRIDAFRTETSWLTLIGRRAAGASLSQIKAELGVIAAGIDQQQPPRRTVLAVERASRLSSPEGRLETFAAGSVLMTAFGLVLLIACANVANLLLARTTSRAREIAVRLSLGATRARIVQQLLAESLLIAVSGGAIGALLTGWTVQSLVRFAIARLPAEARSLNIETVIDARVLAYAIAATLASAVLFGLAPALHASKPDLQAAIKVDGAGIGPRSRGRLQGVLVGVQVALCMVLMISAGVLLRGLYEAMNVEPGFEYKGVSVASFDLNGAGYDAARAAAFQRELAERVAALPGIDAVAQAAITPLYPGTMGFTGRVPKQEQWLPMSFNWVSPGYFSLVEIPIVRGRTFTDAEVAAGGALVVTDATARRLWPDRDPIGQRLEYAASNVFGPDPVQTISLEVVGVAADAQMTGIGEVPSNYVYLPSGPRAQLNLQLLAKSELDFATTARAIRAAGAELDRALVVRVAPLETNLDFWRKISGLVSSIATSLGALALVLASVGIYGVVAYAVGRRAREIGIRMALGASAGSIVGLMLHRTMRPVVVGAAIGLVAALGASQIISSKILGVSPADPLALLGAALVVTAVAFAAGALPARRAARLDPSKTLHYE
ncbi:MAG TPA: ABC transporter permease [Gammaproteobacteria bacterium]